MAGAGVNEAGAAPTRSTFVTLTAWFGIVTAGCATPLALVQTLMAGTLSEQLSAALDSQELSHMPASVRYLVDHLGLVSGLFLLGSVVTLVCSIGLLKRQNWGRLGVIALLFAGIVQQLALFWIQTRVAGMVGVPGETPPEIQTGVMLMQVVGGVLTVVQVGVFVWMIWKLMTPGIRAEFGV